MTPLSDSIDLPLCSVDVAAEVAVLRLDFDSFEFQIVDATCKALVICFRLAPESIHVHIKFLVKSPMTDLFQTICDQAIIFPLIGLRLLLKEMLRSILLHHRYLFDKFLSLVIGNLNWFLKLRCARLVDDCASWYRVFAFKF